MANTVSRMLSDETLNRIIQIESAGKPSARAGTSSAAGLGQFITATWLETVRKHRLELARSAGTGLASMRVGPETAALQLEMLARFTEDNARALGAGFTDGDLYLAHFLGLGDARRLFRAPPGDPAPSHVTAAAVTANRSILAGKTCAQVRAWAQTSMQSRWERAGRPDWVKKYAGAPVVMPTPATPAKPAPAKDVGKIGGGAAAGGGVVVATGAAVEAGWSVGEIVMMIVIMLVLAGLAYSAWRWWQARKATPQEIASDEALSRPDWGFAPPGPAEPVTFISRADETTADDLAASIAAAAKARAAVAKAATWQSSEITVHRKLRRKPKKAATVKRRAAKRTKKRAG